MKTPSPGYTPSCSCGLLGLAQGIPSRTTCRGAQCRYSEVFSKIMEKVKSILCKPLFLLLLAFGNRDEAQASLFAPDLQRSLLELRPVWDLVYYNMQEKKRRFSSVC